MPNSDEHRTAAERALGIPYPSLGTTDPVAIAKAQAFALLAIAEELAVIRAHIALADTGPIGSAGGEPPVSHIVYFTPAEDPALPGLPAAEWRCACGEGSKQPIAPPTAARRAREHLNAMDTRPGGDA